MADDPARSLRIAIVGGGITGLAAAHRLRELAPDCDVSLLESSHRWGGVISTLHQDGYQVELSADNFITTVPWGVDFCKRIGLGDQLIQTNPTHRHTFVVRKGRLCKLPDGFLMMAPTRLWPLALTPILSPIGKLRAAMEYFLPPRRGDDDESMARFVKRRLGGEVFDRLVEPLVSAVYAADMERLSVEATLPQFRQMEREFGSLIRAMRKRMAAERKGPAGNRDSGARYSMFVTPKNGLSSMVDAVVDRLQTFRLRLNSPVYRIERAGNGSWAVFVVGEAPESFDGVILAAPSHVASYLMGPVDGELSSLLATIEHSGTAIVSVGFQREQVRHPLNGMGAVVPAVEKSPLLACSFSSQKYAHRAPEGHVLLRLFAGGARRPELAVMPDDELVPLLLEPLSAWLGIKGSPAFCHVAHWPNTMPQYHVDHKRLVSQIRTLAGQLPGLQLAGNAYGGVGIPNCIHSGETAAEEIVAQMRAKADAYSR